MPDLPTKALHKITVTKQTNFNDVGSNSVRGLALRVSPSGARTWVVTARRPGKKNPSRYKLEDLRNCTLSQARDLATDFKKRFREGEDPVRERSERINEARRFENSGGELAALIDEFIRHHVADKKATTQKDYLRLLKRILEKWGRRSRDSIQVHEIIDWIDQETISSPSTARQLHAIGRLLFSYGVERGRLLNNPFSDIRPPKTLKARDRWLAECEVVAFWKATESMTSLYAPAFQFLLVTGQRRSEVAGMRWEELNLQTGLWSIPSSRTKNSKPHMLDLPPFAMDILLRINQSGDFVFGGGARALNGWSKAKSMLDKIMRENGDTIKPWRTHDLRRTMATHLAEQGTDQYVIEKLLNHSSGSTGGIVSVYQRSERRQERKVALQSWCLRLESLVCSS
jgi:integrase